MINSQPFLIPDGKYFMINLIALDMLTDENTSLFYDSHLMPENLDALLIQTIVLIILPVVSLLPCCHIHLLLYTYVICS